MKVLFDHDLFFQPIGGASKYFVMLLKYMPRKIWTTTTLLSCNEYVKSCGILPSLNLNNARFWNRVERLNIRYTKYRLEKGSFDVYHQTNYGLYGLDSVGAKPMVTTFHDVNQATIDPVPEVLHRQKVSLKRADSIIVVSENTKKELLELYDVDEKKVNVIYHGIELPNLDLLPSRRIIDAPYVLYVGRRSPYKNFHRFVVAYSKFHQVHPEIKLVCTSSPFTSEELEHFKKLNILQSVIHVRADEQMMSMLYRDALFFVFPSLSEGFGMPILEAWAHHCPVALSNTSCFPEITSDAGLYFDPYEEDDIFSAMLRLAENEDLRSELILKGDKRVLQFSWEECAKKHIDVYKSLI